jgi:glutaredoxin
MPTHLENYTKKQLLEKAKERGKKSYSSLNKSQLIDLLRSGRTYYKSPKRLSRKSPKRTPKKRDYGSRGYSPSNLVFNENVLKNNKFVIIGKEKCPHCIGAKKFMDDMDKTYKYIEYPNLNQDSKDKIKDLTNNYTKVPMVFIDGKFIGGFSELKKELK